MKKSLIALLIMLLMREIAFSSEQSSQDYSIVRQSFSNSGQRCLSTDYEIVFTAGQSGTIGAQASEYYANHSGYWYSNGIVATPTPTNTASATVNPTQTPYSTATSTRTPTMTPTIVFTSTPSVTPTLTLPPSPTLTPTPVSCTLLGVDLWMPSHNYYPGQTCSCGVFICNPEMITYEDVPLFVVLDVYGQYLFAPEYDDFAFYRVSVKPGIQYVEVIPEFTWPLDAGEASGLRWHAGMTNPSITEMFGVFDSWEFGWSE